MPSKPKKKPVRGRPREGRVLLSARVLPATKKKINGMVDKSDTLFNTAGKILDEKFSVN